MEPSVGAAYSSLLTAINAGDIPAIRSLLSQLDSSALAEVLNTGRVSASSRRDCCEYVEVEIPLSCCNHYINPNALIVTLNRPEGPLPPLISAARVGDPQIVKLLVSP